MKFSSLRTLAGILLIGLIESAGAASGPKTIEMSVVTDYETVEYFGGPEAVLQYIEELAASTARIYREQLDTDVIITFSEIPTKPEHDTIAGHTNAQHLLEDLQLHRLDNAVHRASDVTTLFTIRELTEGSKRYIGYASAHTVCSKAAAAIVRLRKDHHEHQTLAHEIAHTVGASHDGMPPCEHEPEMGYLMGAKIAVTETFSQCSIDLIKRNMERFGDCYDALGTSPTGNGTAVGIGSGGLGSCDPGFLLVFLMIGVVTCLVRYACP